MIRLPRGRRGQVRVVEESAIEPLARSTSIRERLGSPWLVIVQYIFNICIVVLIALLFSNQAQFTDYLNGRGELRDREAEQLREEQIERSEQSRETLCDLIAALEADLGGQLQRISEAAGCAAGPIQPGEPQDTNPEGSNPDDSNDRPMSEERSSTGLPPTGSTSGTGDAGAAAPGLRSTPPPPTASPDQPAPSEPGPEEEPPPPSDEDRGGLSDDADVCIVILGCAV